MNASIEKVREVWGFDLPDDYIVAVESGLLTRNAIGSLRHSVIKWMTASEISRMDTAHYGLREYVPFSLEPNRSSLCWSVEHGPGWVFDVGRGDPIAEGYAPSYAGAIYRAMLEDLCETSVPHVWGMTYEQYVSWMAQCVNRCRGLWRPEWCETVWNIINARPKVNDDQSLTFISSRGIKEIIKKELRFEMLNNSLVRKMV